MTVPNSKCKICGSFAPPIADKTQPSTRYDFGKSQFIVLYPYLDGEYCTYHRKFTSANALRPEIDRLNNAGIRIGREEK